MERKELMAARMRKIWTQEQVANFAGVSVRAYRSWELGTTSPRASSIQRICDVFEQSAESLGLLLEHGEEKHHTMQTSSLLSSLLTQDLTLRLLCLTFTYHHTPAELQRAAKLILEESMIDPITRREALSRLVALVVAPIAAPPLSATATETTLARCAAAIIACRELGQGQDIPLALEGANAIQRNTIPLMTSPQHRVAAATLAAQAGILATVFTRHLQGPEASLATGQQAIAYARLSDEKTMQILALETLAWSYYHLPGGARSALQIMEQAVVLMKNPNIPLYMHGPAYGALAIMQASLGLPSTDAFRQAEKLAFADQHYAYFVDNPIVTLIRNEAELAYQRNLPEQAIATLTTHLIDEKTYSPKKYDVSQREHIRALSLVAMASLKTKDLERSVTLWKPWMQSAQALKSKLCMNEAMSAYRTMDIIWPHDQRVYDLRGFVMY